MCLLTYAITITYYSKCTSCSCSVQSVSAPCNADGFTRRRYMRKVYIEFPHTQRTAVTATGYGGPSDDNNGTPRRKKRLNQLPNAKHAESSAPDNAALETARKRIGNVSGIVSP